MRVPAVLFFGIASGPLIAGTVSMQVTSNFAFTPPGNTSCAQSGIGPISCSIFANFSDPSGTHGAHAEGSVMADFGSIAGSIFSFVEEASMVASYESSFEDYVTVLGGAGAGTLITHYQLVSSQQQTHAIGQAVPPVYSFLQGDQGVSYTPPLPQLDSPLPATLTENFDVMSPITFGEPLRLAAQTGATHGAGFSFPCCFGPASRATTSNAQITGYTVLDSSGATVVDATVQRGNVPEPGTVWAGIIAVLIFTTRYSRRL